MSFTYEVSIANLIFVVIGCIITYCLSTKLNKHSYQIALRKEKFDEFIASINLLRDMIDIVIQDCRLKIVNYFEFGEISENNSITLFNHIFETASKCSTLVSNYGKLFEVEKFKYVEIIQIHNLAFNIEIRIHHFLKNSNSVPNEIDELKDKLEETEKIWKELRIDFIEMCSKAYEKQQNDLK